MQFKFLIILLCLCGCPVGAKNAENNLKILFKTFNVEYVSYICLRNGATKYECVVNTKLNEQKLITCTNNSCGLNSCNFKDNCFKSETAETIETTK